MIKIEILGLHNNQRIPLFVCDSGGIVSNPGDSNNKQWGNVQLKGVLCGVYRNQWIPIRVNDNGELEV